MSRGHSHIVWKRIGIGAIAVAVAVVVFALTFDWNRLRGPIAQAITRKTGRPAEIDGNLAVHLLSWSPGLTIEGLKIGNPTWAQRPLMLDLPKLTVRISLPRLITGHLVITQLAAVAPRLDLERDAEGRASWEFGSAGAGEGNPREAQGKIPAIRQLDIAAGKIRFADRIRKLDLNADVSANERRGSGGGFTLNGTGSLNSRPFRVDFSGSPLLDVAPDHAYSFESHIQAGDIDARATVRIAHPFDLTDTQASVSVSGQDLANGFYLTGLALPNTPPYRFSAEIRREGTNYQLDNVRGELGHSDIEGQLHVDTGRTRPKLTGSLKSKALNFPDLGASLGAPGGSGAAPAATRSSFLMPDADLQLNRVRGMDADVRYRADSVAATPGFPLHAVNFHVTLDDGLLRIDPVSFVLPQGEVGGAVSIDARAAVPESTVDLRLSQIDLGQIKTKAEADGPLGGTLVGRVDLHGPGASIHKFAAHMDGSVSLVIPSGTIRAAFAELTGINVAAGLGLLLTKDEKQSDIRCGVASFVAKDGMLDAKTVVIDTSHVLITGGGDVNFATEAVDFQIQGKPKQLRLVRLRTPIELGGSLQKPTVGVSATKLIEQAGAATALGVVLTPVAAVLAFVDPGLAKNANCAALTAGAGAGGR